MSNDTSQLTRFTVRLLVTAGMEDAFLEASRANRAGARQEPGNLRFDIYRSNRDKRRFLFVEAYESVAAITHHRETPHFQKWIETAGPMLAEPRERVEGDEVPPDYEEQP